VRTVSQSHSQSHSQSQSQSQPQTQAQAQAQAHAHAQQPRIKSFELIGSPVELHGHHVAPASITEPTEVTMEITNNHASESRVVRLGAFVFNRGSPHKALLEPVTLSAGQSRTYSTDVSAQSCDAFLFFMRCHACDGPSADTACAASNTNARAPCDAQHTSMQTDNHAQQLEHFRIC